MGLFGFPATPSTVSAEKVHACIALDTSNIRPLKFKPHCLCTQYFPQYLLHVHIPNLVNNSQFISYTDST